ncbi:ParM/StbA family protein [Priestia filamentosa]|uniref:ParM/StbA family protein n=1 Tax=Priestia filamentosa TaxID=1402861 RepID=UPI0005890D30
MAANYEFKMGNDNGNANHDVIINGEYFTQPNVNRVIYKLTGYDNVALPVALAEIMERIVATVTSPTITPGIYLIGKSALTSGKQPNEFAVGFVKKSDSDIPVINTLGVVAAYAVKHHYAKTKKEPANGDELNVKMEMTTALPIKEYYEDKKHREIFTEKFLKGPHSVTLHLGEVNVTVKIEFSKVYVTPEAASVFWALNDIDNHEELANKLFAEFIDEYNLEMVSGKEVAESKILHLDIGSGTTEFPLTIPTPSPAFITGKDYGIGHAIDSVLQDVGDKIGIPELTRLEFDQILLNPTNAHHHMVAKQMVEPYLREQADNIIEQLLREMRKARMDFDYILVYGGGSVLLKEFLYNVIKEQAEKTGRAKVIYVPAELAVKLNALGLNAFVNHEVFQVKTKDQVKEESDSLL